MLRRNGRVQLRSVAGHFDHRPSVGFGGASAVSHRVEGEKVPKDEIAAAIARCAGCLVDSVASEESIYNGKAVPSIATAAYSIANGKAECLKAFTGVGRLPSLLRL
jgi:hypothetical protein